ncbi:MAG: helix-turn-helix transcriptional regulator [Magnetospirillum sp.]
MLSKRETECLSWFANGKTAWETAQILDISESTVIFHIENAKKKLGATNVTHAVAIAVTKGWVAVDPTKGSELGE